VAALTSWYLVLRFSKPGGWLKDPAALASCGLDGDKGVSVVGLDIASSRPEVAFGNTAGP
jgi:hypothetical protein